MTLIDGVRTRLDSVWGSENYAALGLLANDSLASMRDRSRNLQMKNPLAASIVDRAVENVVGASGLVLRAATSDKLFNAEANDYWKQITVGTRMDVRNLHSWGKIQRLVFRHTKVDGDVGVVLVDQGFGPQLQIILGSDIETPPDQFNPRIIDGVEYNNIGRPIAFWIRQMDEWGIVSHKRVLARDVIFIHDHFQYNASRGMPTFQGSYTLFDQIAGYLDAVVVAARIGASQAMIAKRKSPSKSLKQLGGRDEDSAGNTRRTQPIQPGTITYLDANDAEDLTAFNPAQPQVQFPDAMRTFARFLGLRFGLTIERVLLDFSKANYSVSRSTALQEIKTSGLEQYDYHARMHGRIWRWAISKGIKSGRIKRNPPPDYLNHEWMPEGRPVVEPSKDAPGQMMQVKLGVESIKNIAAESGYDWEQNIKDNAEAIALMRSLGLPDPLGGSTGTSDAGNGDSTFSDTPIEDDNEKGSEDAQQSA